MNHWSRDAFFYHIYPLGAFNCPRTNDFVSPPVSRLAQLTDWADHIQTLGANALYLGPLFESTSHGYDTADFYHVDRRLGTNDTLKEIIHILRDNGIRVIVDGVFHHVGRDFWAFSDVLANQRNSDYVDWFCGIDFDRQSPLGDPFSYETWDGHWNLVKLNLQNEAVTNHILQAVSMWIHELGIHGLRLDVADKLPEFFMKKLASFCKGEDPDFWLMGEVIHGDYRDWVAPGILDSVTNYQCYKGLYSSHRERNYFEIAWSLNRQFSDSGIYRNMPLYSFVDNHDVDRISDSIGESSHLFPVHCLLFTMPGVPSVYYGSEWATPGKKTSGDDWHLRPPLTKNLSHGSLSENLFAAIIKLAEIRKNSKALKRGSYKQLYVSNEQLAFLRSYDDERVIIVVNASTTEQEVNIPVPSIDNGIYEDRLNNCQIPIVNGVLDCEIPPCWARILRV